MAAARKPSSMFPDLRQQQAIEYVHGPMLVVAGAGTGKTTVLTRRIAHLIREGHARPDEILALTYTINAADVMRERVERDLGPAKAKGLQISTFHAYCNNLLIRAGRNFKVLDDKQSWIFLRRNIRELKLNWFVRAANVSKFLDDLLDFIRRCHDELVSPEQYAEYVCRIECGELRVPRVAKSKDAVSDGESLARCHEIASVYAKVEQMLRDRSLGTFGHMIVQANALLARDSTLLDAERRRAKFILVDEFQDANFAQIEVLHKLADAGERNIFVVGDPDQGIYRFRGASSGAFDVFLQRFPEAKTVALTNNRRSTTPILRLAHAVISKNPEGFNLTTQYRRAPLVAARDEEEVTEAGQRSPVEIVLVSGSFMEATDLVSTLIERRRRTRCRWKDIAVLYRSHVHREEVAAELARNQVPFSIEGLDILDTPEVRDLLACAGAVVSLTDSASLFRIAALKQFAIDPEALRSAVKMIPWKIEASIVTILPQVPSGQALLTHLDRVRQEISNKPTPAALLSLTSAFQIPRNQAIRTLLNFATAWEKTSLTETGSLAEFLEYLDHFREARGTIPLPASDEDDTVKLMTVHGVKGLEFDHVFVLRAVSPSFPTPYREPLIDFPPELRASRVPCDDKTVSEQEERRLFYVAMTRARNTLTLYGPFGKGKTEKTPPGYLRELLKDRDLTPWLCLRNCREFQTEIFAAAAPLPTSRLAEWVALPPASNLAATLSASSIDNYKLCPLRFKLDREWRIPGEVSAALQYGASVHRVLRTYYDSVRWSRPKSDAELIQLFRDDLVSEAIVDRYQHDLYEKQGIAQLREFLAAARLENPSVIHTEEQFNIKIGENTLVGRIDRIDRGGGDCVVIVDYKTGKPKSQEDADRSLQLSLYALAAREKWGYTAERLVFHNLEGNVVIRTQRSSIELEEAKLEVEEIAQKIAAGKFAPTPGYHCNSCAYRVLCPKTEKRLPEIAPTLAVRTTQ